MDVGIIFWIYSFEFQMQGFVSGAGQAGISFRHLGEWISFMEVGVVIISWEPACCLVGYFVGLGTEELVLNEASEWFCISEVFCP